MTSTKRAKRSTSPSVSSTDNAEGSTILTDDAASSTVIAKQPEKLKTTMFVLYAFTEFGEDSTEDGGGSEILGVYFQKEDAIAAADDYVMQSMVNITWARKG